MYDLIRSLLFRLPAERSHDLALRLMDVASRLHVLGAIAARDDGHHRVDCLGLTFPNPVGLAAGLDKDAAHLDALGALGFGFIEVGTLTPKPQPGNPQPRLFRLAEQQAIINRMGFNNRGVDHALECIAASRYEGILGINIGKNASTPLEQALDDYLIGLRKVYSAASYVTVNLSSPNTPGLRALQFGEPLRVLLSGLKETQIQLAQQQQRRVPVLIKLAPDLSAEDLGAIAEQLIAHDVEGVIATNTTLDRSGIAGHPLADEAGGLSGAPLTNKSTEVVRTLKAVVGDRLPIIGVGGILRGQDALDKLAAGASLVQIYTGFIYRGPALIEEILEALPSP